jgi:tetratricopeptide (TPR) repeat protein
LFASGAERRYHEGVLAYLAGAALRAFEASLAAGADSPSANLFAALAGEKVDAPEGSVVARLEAVIASPYGLPDRLQSKYLPANVAALSLKVAITEHITADAPVSSIGAALILAEHYQAADRLSEAIGLIHQIQQVDVGNPVVSLSLADLLFADGDYDGVLDATSTAVNDSDLGVAMLHLRGAALYSQGHAEAGLEMFKQALAKTSGRDDELLKLVRYDRALAYEQSGQNAKAKADFERIYAVDPGFQDVRERLAALA